MSNPRNHRSRAVAGCQCDGCLTSRTQANERRNALRAAARGNQPPAPPKPRNTPPVHGLPEVDPAEWEYLRVGYGVRRRG